MCNKLTAIIIAFYSEIVINAHLSIKREIDLYKLLKETSAVQQRKSFSNDITCSVLFTTK